MKQDTEGESMFKRSQAFNAVTASFLKRIWRETVCHVSLVN